MKHKTRRRLLRIARVIAVLLAVLTGVWLYSDVKWGRVLDAKLSELRAEGVPITMAEVAPKPVPSEQNAAVPYQQVFCIGFTPDHWDSAGLGPLSYEDLKTVWAYIADGDPQLEARVRAMLSDPGAKDALDTLRRASKRPYSVFRVNWENGVWALFPHLAKLDKGTGVVVARAALSAADEDVPEALMWFEVAFRMSQHAASDPTLGAQVVSWRMHKTIFGCLQNCITRAAVPPPAAQDLVCYLGRMDLDAPFNAAMVGEMAVCWEALDVFERPRDVQGYFAPCLLQNEPSREYKILASLWVAYAYASIPARPLRKIDRVVFLEYTNEMIQLSRLPHRLAEPKARALCQRVEQLQPRPQSLVGTVLPLWAGALEKRDTAKAQIGLCRVGLALEAYNYEKGSYPATLADMQEALDWELPKDVFSGKDFVYQRQEDGFKLYSIGPNLRDDGGIPERDSAGKRREDCDIVWECVR